MGGKAQVAKMNITTKFGEPPTPSMSFRYSGLSWRSAWRLSQTAHGKMVF